MIQILENLSKLKELKFQIIQATLMIVITYLMEQKLRLQIFLAKD